MDYEFTPYGCHTPPKVLRQASMVSHLLSADTWGIPLTNHSDLPLTVGRYCPLGVIRPLTANMQSYHLDPSQSDHRRARELMISYDQDAFNADGYWRQVLDSKGPEYVQGLYDTAKRSYLNDLFATTAREHLPPVPPPPDPDTLFTAKNLGPQLSPE